MFYLLSLLTGVLECGWIAFGAVHSLPLWQILCYPLAYHIGNLFPKPFSLNRSSLICMSVLSVFMGGLTFIKQLSVNTVFVLTCLTLFFVSTVIQSVRSGLKSDGNRLLKRVFRVGGFVLAPFAAAIPSVILVFSAAFSLFALKRYSGECGITKMKWQNGISAVMLFHQLHYFFYAHITLTAVSLAFAASDGDKGVWYAELLFCGTWITYMSVEPIVSKITSKVGMVFYMGHIGISALLFSMNFLMDKPIFPVLWIATGFGGGVVYTIAAHAKLRGDYDKDSMTISENIGHTFGLLAAVGISCLFGELSPRIMLAFGSVSALLAVITMVLISRKENSHENIHNKC